MSAKILFLIPTLMHGGAEKVLVNLVNNLDPKKYDVTLYSIFDDGVNKQFLQPHVRYLYKFRKVCRGNSQLMKIFSSRFLYKWLIKDDYDIAVSFLEGPSARIVSGCSNPKTKKIAWIHTEQKDASLVSVGFRNVNEAKECYGKFDTMVGVSNDVVESVCRNITHKIPLKALYNVNDSDLILKKGTENLLETSFQKQGLQICSVGKIIQVKGYERLMDVHKKLIDENLLHSIHIVGIGNEQQNLEKRAKELGISDTFKFLGFHKNPYPIIKQSDLFVCSSFREGFSTAVTEALILGVPVLSTQVSGATELLGENNEYGMVVENSTAGIYNGLKEILSNPEKLKRYKKQAEIRGGYFSKEKTVKAVENLFDDLMKNGKN